MTAATNDWVLYVPDPVPPQSLWDRHYSPWSIEEEAAAWELPGEVRTSQKEIWGFSSGVLGSKAPYQLTLYFTEKCLLQVRLWFFEPLIDSAFF